MQGYIRINGTLFLVELDIQDEQIIITVPKEVDVTNWYHAVCIKSI